VAVAVAVAAATVVVAAVAVAATAAATVVAAATDPKGQGPNGQTPACRGFFLGCAHAGDTTLAPSAPRPVALAAMSKPRHRLAPAEAADDWAAAAEIVAEYAKSLGVDLSFQAIDSELADLPQHYAEPGGVLLLAWVGTALAGCGALKPLPDADYPNACEMRRLYVRPAYRRLGLGRVLAQALIDWGVRAGYSCMLLDTLDDMEAARGLYDSLGFEEVPPFYFNPLPGAHYLKVDLQ